MTGGRGPQPPLGRDGPGPRCLAAVPPTRRQHPVREAFAYAPPLTRWIELVPLRTTVGGETAGCGASAPRFAGRTRKVTCARPLKEGR